jgi:hypothetical protein
MINPLKTAIPLDTKQVEVFCQKWKIREFSLFGSILRDDFRPESDGDGRVEFEEDAAGTVPPHRKANSWMAASRQGVTTFRCPNWNRLIRGGRNLS